jgi:RNA polymerase sigma factor (sigma-70 family)
MRAASIPARSPAARPLRSRRLLALAGDERLVEQIRRGNEAAFEVVFERHAPAILGFCRHMLGSPEEAEDAVQHTFGAAYSDLQRDRERDIALKPWLFAIARNRCLSLLRARREQPLEEHELPTTGLSEQVEQRAELRRLLADLRELPHEQRAALLLSELGDLSHTEVAGVLGCEVPRVKALVFRARSSLIARREAREAPCDEIREQLANLRGGSLRRTELRLHLRECSGCRAYREQVKQQRRMLAAALPVAPTLGLKGSVLAAIGLGGGSGGGGAAAAGLSGVFGSATVAKVAIVGVVAGGGAVAGQAVIDPPRDAAPAKPQAVVAPGEAGPRGTSEAGGTAAARPTDMRSAAPADRAPVAQKAGRRGGERRAGTGPEPTVHGGKVGRGRPAAKPAPPGLAKEKPGRRRGHERTAREDIGQPPQGRGRGVRRGPVEAPPPSTPVKRGPPEKAPKPAKQTPPGQAKAKPKGAAAKPVPPPKIQRAAPPASNGKGKAESGG